MGEQNQPPNEQDQQRLQALLQRGINDARLKNKEEARAALREAVRIDPQSEKGWFWLASVAESDDERLVALQNVVLINPDNQRAFQILEKLEQVRSQKEKQKAAAKAAEAPASNDLASLIGGSGEDAESIDEEAAELTDLDNLESAEKKSFSLGAFSLDSLETFTIGNFDPQKSRLILMGGAAAVLAVCFICILALAGGGGGDEEPVDDGGNNVANVNPTAVPTEVIENTEPTATLFLTATPPPSPTPTETITPTPEPVTYPAPPNEVTGNLLMSAGPYASGYQPVVLFNLYEDTSEDISGGDYGSYPSLNGDSSKFVYIEYSQGSRRADAKIVNRFDPDEEQFLDDYWDRQLVIDGLDMPAWSPSNTMIAFVADPIAGGSGKNLFILTLNSGTPAEGTEGTEGDGGAPAQGTDSPFIEVQSNETYTEPAWSPDSARIVVVSDAQTNSDLRAYEIGTGKTINLTNDGNVLRESSPDWSADGRIIFSGELQTGEGSDIYIMPSDGSGAPNLFIDLGPHDINPRWSPDNRYIAFSSDINGAYNVYVYDLANDTFYTVTNETRLDSFLADWVR